MPTVRSVPAVADVPAEQLLLEGLVHASRTFRHHLWPELERERLTSPMFWALSQLVQEGPMSVGRLAGACSVTPANVSAAVEGLESAGLVVRSSPPRDRRVVTLTVTRKGRALYRTLWGRLARRLVGSLGGVPPSDMKAASRVLARLAQLPAGPTAPAEVYGR